MNIFSKSNYKSSFFNLALIIDSKNEQLKNKEDSINLKNIILSVAENFQDVILMTSFDEISKIYAALMKLIWGSKVFVSLDENLQNTFEWTDDNKIIFDGAIVNTKALEEKFSGIIIANPGDENKLSGFKNSNLLLRVKLEKILYGTKTNQFILNIFEKYRHLKNLENRNSEDTEEKIIIQKIDSPRENLELNSNFKKLPIFIFDGKCEELDSLSSSISTIQLIKALKKFDFNVSLISEDELMWQIDFLMFKSLNIKLHLLNKSNILDMLSNVNEIFVIIFRNVALASNYAALLNKLANAKVLYFGHAFFNQENDGNNFLDQKLINAQNQLFETLDMFTFPSVPEINFLHKHLTLKKKLNKTYKNLPEFISSSPRNNHGMFSRINKSNNILLFGNFSFKHNIEGLKWFLAECFPNIINKSQGVKLIIGTPENLGNIDNLLSNNIILRICRTRQDLEKLIIDSKIAIWPSSYKYGPSFFIYESMKQGLPCVSTALGSSGFELANKLGALRIYNDTKEFTQGIIELLDDETARKKISYNALEFSENFNSLYFFQEKLKDNIFNFLT